MRLGLLICPIADAKQGRTARAANQYPMFLRNSRISCRLRLGALCGLLSLTTLGMAARHEQFPGETAKWRRYQSPNFEMFSASRDFDSRDLLHNLETLRALFFETFKVKERQPLEVSVYYFNNAAAFKAYVHTSYRQELAGFYLHRPDRAVIAISPAWSDETARYVIFHEYIHHLNRVIGSNPPVWYNEGTAELLSTIEVEKDGVVLGKPLPWHVQSLREKPLLPLETLFSVDHASPIYNTGKHTGQLYAQAWALLHYLRFGKNNLDKEKVDLFLRYILNEELSADPDFRRKLFDETMGMDYSTMQRALGNYVSGGSFSYYKAALPSIPEAKAYEFREMPHEEIRERLAELSLRVNQAPLARLAILQAAEKSPSNFRLWEVLGTDSWLQGDADVAQERWQRALEAGTNNPAVYHELGQMEGRRWFTTFDYYFRMPEVRAQNLRALLKRSIECAPEQSEAYEMLAWVEASVVKPDIANINLVQLRFKSLNNKAKTLLALALVRLRLDDPAASLKLLDQLDKMNPGYWVASAAEIVRAKLEDRDPKRIAPPETDQTFKPIIRMKMPDLPH